MPKLNPRHRLLAILLLIILLAAISRYVPIYGDECWENLHTGSENCTPHHILVAALWNLGAFLNYYGVAITAAATVFIGWFTYTLATTSDKQVRLARDAIELGNKEFISSHRSKMRALGVTVITPNGGRVWNPVAIFYEVTNIGITQGHVTQKNFAVKLIAPGDRLIGLPSFDAQNEDRTRTTLSGGQSHVGTFVSELRLSPEQEDQVRRGALELMFYGYIEYIDAIDVVRRAFFLQRLDYGLGRFFTVEDPHYERPN